MKKAFIKKKTKEKIKVAKYDRKIQQFEEHIVYENVSTTTFIL